jgi:hypothetical protein
LKYTSQYCVLQLQPVIGPISSVAFKKSIEEYKLVVILKLLEIVLTMLFFLIVATMIQQAVYVSSFQGPSSNFNVGFQRNLLDISRLTTIEVGDYVRDMKALNGAAPIVIAIGATEQHGPTGLIGTDSQTSLAVAKKVCEECNVLLGPQLQIGMSLHHCG